jgi:DNA topoisomerase VI subunit A
MHLISLCKLIPVTHPVNKTLSQRDVYYSLKSLFKNQADCNKAIIDVGLFLGVKRCKYLSYIKLYRFHL